MKILRHGTLYKFECDKCGCEFVAGANECINAGFFMSLTCPECGSEARNPNKKEGEDEDV